MQKLEKLFRIVNLINDDSLNMSRSGKQIIERIPNLKGRLRSVYSSLVSGKMGNSKLNSGSAKALERLENELLNHLLKNDFYSDLRDPYNRTWYRCVRNMLLCQLLCLKDRRTEARSLMIYSLRSARRHQFTSISLELCRMLRYDVALTGKKNKFKDYCKLEKDLMMQNITEIKAEELSSSIVLGLHHRYSMSSQFMKEIKLAYSELKKIVKKHPSHLNQIYYFRIATRYYITNRAPGMVIQLNKNFQKYLDKNPHLNQLGRRAEMALYAMDACLELRDIKTGKSLAEFCNSYFIPFSGNWFIFQEIWLLLCLHAENYEYAQLIFNRVTRSEAFKRIESQRMEKWKLFEVYLNLILFYKNGFIRMSPIKLLNNLPVYGNDKRGLNYPILIAEFICLLTQEYDDRIVDFQDQFNLYVKRYVSRKKHYRTWYFSKLIHLLFKYNFDANKCNLIGEKYFIKLKEFKERKLRDYEMIEIIPYEHLWRHIINFISHKRLIKKIA